MVSQIPAETDRSVQQDHEIQVAPFPRFIPRLGTVEEDSLQPTLECGFQPNSDLFPVSDLLLKGNRCHE